MTITGPQKAIGYLPKNTIAKEAIAARADADTVRTDLMLRPA